MLTHVNPENGMPAMVDVTGKAVTERTARAQAKVQLPPELGAHLKGDELVLEKGPVFQTAIIAGTMAVKKTYEVIPFCHQIPIESCKFNISVDSHLTVTIDCIVKTTFKTGVEMEALHGATIAAITVYDMCKAVSHNMVISDVKLLAKSGGKRLVSDRPLFGLVMTGGKSERMKRDKALITYMGVPHAQYIYDVLSGFCDGVYLSARKDQWKGSALETMPAIEDEPGTQGPIAGLLSAFRHHPEANWIVVACDLIHFNKLTVERLLASHDPSAIATAYKNTEKGFPEPLCTMYTPQAERIFRDAAANGITCPVKVLRNSNVKMIDQTDGVNLANVNTVEELEGVQLEIG